MKYEEVVRDLFTVGQEYHLAHCISADAKMGAGIAVEFKKRFKLNDIRKHAKEYGLKVGSCVMVNRVLNLITKEGYWQKPTYENFTESIEAMKGMAITYNIKKIAMPTIGAGLDRLDWNKNREIIKGIFEDTDIEILVCKLEK